MNDLISRPFQKRVSRRHFLQSAGITGAALGLSAQAHAFLPDALKRIADSHRKKITLLEDGSFVGSAWGWQFTGGASIAPSQGRGKTGAVQVETSSGDYARFLVLGPVVGKTYTLTGWLHTEEVVAEEAGGGAYFAASQFEFQGRPTEFTVDGKQAMEIRYGNYTGTSGWTRFTQSIQCLGTTAWFEVAVGIYRAAGKAWFSGLTFVEGDQSAEFEETLTVGEAAELAHQEMLRGSNRVKPRAAVLEDSRLPVRGFRTDPRRLAALLAPTHDVEMLDAAQIADTSRLNRQHFDLLVLSYGETFPAVAKDAMLAFLADGGDLFTTGGYAFQSPVVEEGGHWRFFDETLKEITARNLLPHFASIPSAWKFSDAKFCTTTRTAAMPGGVARLRIPVHFRQTSAVWSFDLPANGEGKQFRFAARLRTLNVEAESDGCASIGVEQFDAQGNPAYAARLTFEEVRGTKAWHPVERIFYLVPDCVTLRVRIALTNATGTLEATDLRLESLPAQMRINTSLGWPEDSLTVKDWQLGIFDADYRLKRAASLRTLPHDSSAAVESVVAAKGYAASGVVGMNYGRWIPVLEGVDKSGRKRGAAGALMHHHNGPYTRSSWAFFGVDNLDLFAPDCKAGLAAFATVMRTLTLKCFLHSAETNYATYRDGEAVRMRCLLSNYGSRRATLRASVSVRDGSTIVFNVTRDLVLRAGETSVMEEAWHPAEFAAEHYRVQIELLNQGSVIDSIESGFNAWKAETLAAGMHVEFRDNYFQVEGRSIFLQGTDDYLHTFIDQDENAGTWRADAQGCRDSALDVYENLMGLRGPQHRPTETWWRWVDAMLLNTQSVGGIFFPGMLVFSNTAVSQADLDDQRAYVKAFAARYGGAAGIMYYLNGDLELHDPNLPDLIKLYNEFLRKKYYNDSALRATWTISPPEAPLGELKIHCGSADWHDIRTLDDFQFRTELVRRWLNAMRDSIREVDTKHPVTAEFYQSPVSGIDLLTALGNLELANFGYFNEKDDDYYRFPQICRFLDQSMRGKGINVGEFGVKTHFAWNDTGYYIEARTEAYEQGYFLSLAHYGFALGASKIQNWCWKYPADLPFEWGINYPNEMVPRDVRAFYRNCGLLFRSLRPRYEVSDTVVLLASDSRMGGQGHRIVEGQLNGIRLLLDQNIRFGTLTDEFLSELPISAKTIFYPLSYCPSDAIVAQLKNFVQRGGQLYLSGDISYDSLRRRTRTDRLRELCGLEFASERYANIDYTKASVSTRPDSSSWPRYDAAPGIVVRPAGATVLLADIDGNPVVTEFGYGQGKVIFSADPIELHGDPRYQTYGHSFYKALAHILSLNSEAFEAKDGSVHCFRVPSQDSRRISVLINYGLTTQTIQLPTGSGQAQLSLKTHVPGIVVSEPGSGIQAVESSGDVFEDGRLLVATDLHFMAISFAQQSLAAASRILLLPMGIGAFTLHTQHEFKKPVLIIGEISGGRWKQYAAKPLSLSGGQIMVAITEELSLSMLLLCEGDDRSETIKQMELWSQSPWKLEESR